MWRRREVAKKDALFASGKLLLPSPCAPSPVEKRESIKKTPPSRLWQETYACTAVKVFVQHPPQRANASRKCFENKQEKGSRKSSSSEVICWRRSPDGILSRGRGENMKRAIRKGIFSSGPPTKTKK